MSEFIKSYSRGRSILQLLKNHGPLSSKAITKIIKPPMKNKRVLGSLLCLSKNNLIEKRYEKIFRGSGTFYQLSQDKESRERISKMIDCQPDELFQPHFRYRELLHNESIALCADKFLELFTDCKIIRDFEFPQSPIAQRVMLTGANNFEVRPDLLLISQGKEANQIVSIAVEIERSRKTNARIVSKLKKYADRTLIDGVIYFCNSRQLIDVVNSLYRKKALTRSSRIGHYSENFMLFSQLENGEPTSPLQIHNSMGQVVRVQDWMRNLKTTSRNERRDLNFKTLGALS